MKILFEVILGIVFTFSLLFAQDLHNPGEIYDIMENSKLCYSMEMAESLKIEKDTTPILNEHGLYVDYSSGKIPKLKSYFNDYESSPEILDLWDKAENDFDEKNYLLAREGYLKIHSKYPKNSQILTFIGQTYESEKNYEEAKKWYKEAIKNNNIDFMAHWFLADAYFLEGKIEEAVDEITIAHILNRNNPRIFKRLKIIYETAGMKYKDWEFLPKYKIFKDDKGEIHLVMDKREKVWFGYMTCKAVWEFEPGYKENMLENADEVSSVFEEKECFTSLAQYYLNLKEEEEIEVEAINTYIETFEDNLASAFLLYEIVLKDNPLLILIVDPGTINVLKKYILEYRVNKI
jgi:tetratricopeptide (TPR) repeat protein